MSLREARGLPVWGLPGSSNPYCQFTLGMQSFGSKRSNDTGKGGFHGNPVWNQDFQFLVQDALGEVLEVEVRDTKLTGKPDIGRLEIPLVRLQEGNRTDDALGAGFCWINDIQHTGEPTHTQEC